ncbi:MAG: autotransporter-associated beta strand repeat-containing protein [Pirellulales bacterium]
MRHRYPHEERRGTWFLSATASTYTGVTTINAGVLKVNLMAAGGAASSIGQSTNAAANFVIGNGATFSYVGSTTSVTDRLLTIGNQSGGRAAIFDSSGTGVVQFTNTAALTGTGATDNTRTFEFTGTAGTIATPNQFAPGIINRGANSTSVIKSGTGVWRLGGVSPTPVTSTFDGSVNIQNGTLIVSNLQNGGVSSSIGQSSNAAASLLIGSATTAATLRFDGSGGSNNSTNRLFTVGAAGATIDASGASGTPLLFTNTGSLVMGAATTTPRTLTLSGSNTDANTFSPVIVNGTGAGLTSLAKSGDGTWVLGSVNTFTGTTTVSDGVLRIGVNNAVNTASAVTVAPSNASDSASFELNGFNLALSNATAALTLGGAANATATMATGSGTLTLGGNVVYDASGNAGTATISGLVATTAPRTFTVGNSSNTASELNVTANISGTGGGIVKAGAGRMTLSGTNSYTGATTVNEGVLTINGANNGTSSVTVGGTGPAPPRRSTVPARLPVPLW